MRRMVRICFLVGLICGTLPVCAAQRDKQATQADSHPVKSVKKTVSLEGRVGLDGKTVVSDQDSRIWKVVNAEMLSGSEGRRVTIKAKTGNPYSFSVYRSEVLTQIPHCSYLEVP